MINKLTELIKEAMQYADNRKDIGELHKPYEEYIAEYLIDNNTIVTPCYAMVEQFLKDGEFDKKRTAHNGKYAVVYVDKSKWNCPLIDITEQYCNAEKALERIQALKGEGKC